MRKIAIARIPEEIFKRPHSEAVQAYLNSKYSKYGFKREHPIEYNPEFVPTSQQHASDPDKYRWVENVSDGLRKVGDANDIVRLGHTGWFVDNFQDETVHGEVYQLPSRGGECQFVPAVSNPWNNDCACVDFSSITNEKENAARWADSMAEQWAEREREYQAKQAAEDRLVRITRKKARNNMETNQPKWKLVAQLGDVHSIDYGGYFVYEDETGVYPPEGEKLFVDELRDYWIVYRFPLDKFALVGDSLVPAHLAERPKTLPYPIEKYNEWFADDIPAVASFIGNTPDQLRSDFSSDDIRVRARAYEAVGEYFGFENLDSYPLQFTSREEIERRYTVDGPRYAAED